MQHLAQAQMQRDCEGAGCLRTAHSVDGLLDHEVADPGDGHDLVGRGLNRLAGDDQTLNG